MPKYNTHFPKIDKIHQDIRDKQYINEAELNEQMNSISSQTAELIQNLKLKKQEMEDSLSNFNDTNEYFNMRIDEIMNDTLEEKQNEIEKNNIFYPDKLNTTRKIIRQEIENTISSFDMGNVTKERIKNKIELLKTRTDENKVLRRLAKNETTENQEYSRLNPDDYSNTRFSSTIFIPYESFNKDIVLFKLKTIPVNYRKTDLKNFKMGAFHLKMSLRSDTVFADLVISSTKLDNNEYGASIVSEGINGVENILHHLKVYYSTIDQNIYVCYNIDTSNSEMLHADSIESQLYSINVNILIGGTIDFSTYYGYVLNNENLTLVGSASLNKDSENIFGPINNESNDYYTRSHTIYSYTEDELFGESDIIRISTIENDKKIEDENLLTKDNIIQYSKEGDVKKDNISEILIRSLESIGLKPGIVYKAMGWVLLDYMYFPIEYLKLTPKNHIASDTFLINEKMCGLEMMFDRRYVVEMTSKNADNTFNQPCFPGISIEGMQSFDKTKVDNGTTATEFNINTPMRNTYYGSWSGSYKNNNHQLQLTRSANISTQFASLDNRSAEIFLSGFDITIITSTKMLNEDISNKFIVTVK